MGSRQDAWHRTAFDGFDARLQGTVTGMDEAGFEVSLAGAPEVSSASLLELPPRPLLFHFVHQSFSGACEGCLSSIINFGSASTLRAIKSYNV